MTYFCDSLRIKKTFQTVIVQQLYPKSKHSKFTRVSRQRKYDITQKVQHLYTQETLA